MSRVHYRMCNRTSISMCMISQLYIAISFLWRNNTFCLLGISFEFNFIYRDLPQESYQNFDTKPSISTSFRTLHSRPASSLLWQQWLYHYTSVEHGEVKPLTVFCNLFINHAYKSEHVFWGIMLFYEIHLFLAFQSRCEEQFIYASAHVFRGGNIEGILLFEEEHRMI